MSRAPFVRVRGEGLDVVLRVVDELDEEIVRRALAMAAKRARAPLPASNKKPG